MSNRINAVQVCDATDDASSNSVGNIKIVTLNMFSFNNGMAG